MPKKKNRGKAQQSFQTANPESQESRQPNVPRTPTQGTGERVPRGAEGGLPSQHQPVPHAEHVQIPQIQHQKSHQSGPKTFEKPSLSEEYHAPFEGGGSQSFRQQGPPRQVMQPDTQRQQYQQPYRGPPAQGRHQQGRWDRPAQFHDSPQEPSTQAFGDFRSSQEHQRTFERGDSQSFSQQGQPRQAMQPDTQRQQYQQSHRGPPSQGRPQQGHLGKTAPETHEPSAQTPGDLRSGDQPRYSEMEGNQSFRQQRQPQPDPQRQQYQQKPREPISQGRPQQDNWKKVEQVTERPQDLRGARSQATREGRDGDSERQMSQQLPSSERVERAHVEKEVVLSTTQLAKLAITTPTTEPTTRTAEPTLEPTTKKSPDKKKYVELNINIKISPTLAQKFLPKRPDDGGKKGRPIPLIINCLDMKIKPMKIFMYDLELTKAEVIGSDQKKRDITIKMKRKEVIRDVVRGFLKDKDGVPVFDGGRIIFTNKLLPFPDEPTKITFNYEFDSEKTTCHFTIQRVKEEDIELNNLNNYVTSGKGRSDDIPQEALRALDTIMKEMFLNKNLLNIGGRAIFDPKTSIPLRCGPYILMEGYATTIRPHMWKVRFNFDKTQVVCHAPIKLMDYIEKIVPLHRFDPRMLSTKLKTLRVEASHLKSSDGKSYSRKYTIHGFSKKSARDERIAEKNITIEQYFQQEYNIKLRHPELQMIKTNPNKDTFVPIELLTVLPFQKVVTNDGKIVQEVIKSAAIPCFDRLTKLKQAIQHLGVTNRADKFLKNYMIEIDPNLINLQGRVLDGPDALFGGQRREPLRCGKWDIRNKQFVKPYDKMINWALFGVGQERDYQRDEQCLYDVEGKLTRAANAVGVKMQPMFRFEYVPYHNIDKVMVEIINQSKKEKKTLDLLVFVVIKDEDYRAVKRFGDMTYGIVTQCMKLGNLSRQKNLDQYLGNIMLKINTKFGGTNWELNAINNISTPIKQPFMVFGIDVTHPASTRNDLLKSIAAMVGSVDNSAALYNATIRQQISKKDKAIVEIVLEMEDMVHQLLMNYYQVNKKLKPRHLIFYRDGVSEGQFEIVFKNEIVAIQNACQRLDKDYQPPITYIVVQKRHKIRFFPSRRDDEVGRCGNVPSGTVVDKDITHCREFDFYLCSHDGIQGTSKPAHYHVLFDENNWGSDDLQSFTYFLCHVYARCTRSVSYPAPTYYAHLAAFRGRTLIGQSDDDSVSITSGHSGRTDSSESQILINDFHKEKLFFI